MDVGEKFGRFRLETPQHVPGNVPGASGESGDGFSAFAGHARHGRAPQTQRRAALEYGSVEQALAHGRQHVIADTDAAGTTAEHRHPAGIAAEFRDVFADPPQRHHLVFHPVVSGHDVVFGAQQTCGGETENYDGVSFTFSYVGISRRVLTQHAQPIVDRHQNHVLVHKIIGTEHFPAAVA